MQKAKTSKKAAFFGGRARCLEWGARFRKMVSNAVLSTAREHDRFIFGAQAGERRFERAFAGLFPAR
jgi:hypothetical protein